jgi:O-antigen/teichoic acid export membrane protein
VKISKFFKDIISTGFSQVGVLIFGIILLKFMALGIDKENFGIFMVVRKWVPVLIPLFTINISIGLVKYVSSQREDETIFLRVSLITASAFIGLVFIGLLFFHDWFSFLLFKSPHYSGLIFISILFVFANILHLLAYSYFRGQLNMTRANILRLMFYGFPVLLAVGIMLFKHLLPGIDLLYLYFVIYSVCGILLAILFLWREIAKTIVSVRPEGIFSLKAMFARSRALFTYSLSRIPTVLCNALIFGLPAFLAVHYLSMVEAGYVAIVVSVVRLLEVFAMPFNMILLPKFSSLQKDGDEILIREYSQVVASFVITFLPILSIFIFGLSRFIIFLWFGPGYMLEDTIDGVALAILFSMFYLSFALIRGILDGLYIFPYNNLISLSGVIAILSVSFFSHQNVLQLSAAFGAGLAMLGIVSVGILVWKVKLNIPWFSILNALLLSFLLGILFFYVDEWILNLHMNPYYTLVIFVLYRVPVLIGVVWLYWRRQLWFKEVMERLIKPFIEGRRLKTQH